MRSARSLTNAARDLERTALDRAPGGGERERSGPGDAARREFRARAAGCAAHAQAGEGTESRDAHRNGRVSKEGGEAPSLKLVASRLKAEC